MNITEVDKMKALDSIDNKIREQERLRIELYPARSQSQPVFVDHSYVPFKYAKEAYLSENLEPDVAEQIHCKLLNDKEARKVEIVDFLHRHKIEIDVQNNDYAQLDEFLKTNITFNRDVSLQWHVVSDFWISVLIDLSFLIGDFLIEEYPFLKWRLQVKSPRAAGYKQTTLYGVGYFAPSYKKQAWVDLMRLTVGYGNRYIWATPGVNKPQVLALAEGMEKEVLKYLRQRVEMDSQ